MPKYILCADLHIRTSKPQFRIDKFENAVLRKLSFIVYCANKAGANIIIAGDVFHNILVKTRLINKVIRILKKCKGLIFAVPGQHDMENHSDDLTPSPFLTLVEAGVILNVGENPNFNVFGIQWNGELDASFQDTDKHSILVVHHTVTEDEPPFFLKDSAISAMKLMEMYKQFPFIVCGDYHVPHMRKTRSQILVNCGALTRSNIDQFSYEPSIYLLNTERRSIQVIPVPIESPDIVFRIPEIDTAKNEKLSEHISNIIELSKAEGKPNFISTVQVIMKDKTFTDRQRKLAQQYYDEVRGV